MVKLVAKSSGQSHKFRNGLVLHLTQPQKAGGFPAWLALLGFFNAVAPLSTDMYLPSFPEMTRALGAPAGAMEGTLSTYFIGVALGQLAYGPISDRVGRKPPLAFGFALFTLASVGCALAQDVGFLSICRFFQGLGGCAGLVMPAAIVRDRTSARESARAFSMLMLVMGLAPILAPMLGGLVLGALGWRAIFWALAGFGLLALLAIRFALNESHDGRHNAPLSARNIAATYVGLLKNPSYLGFILTGGLTMAGMFAYIAGSPFVLIELYGVPPEHYGWFFGLNAIGLIGSSQLNARLLKKAPATAILRRAIFAPPLAGLAMAALAASGMISLPWFAAGFFIFVASIGWIGPNAMASALATHGQIAGSAAALSSALQYVLATLVGAALAFFHNGGGGPLAGMMAVCGCAAWMAHHVLIERRHQAFEARRTHDGGSD